MELTSVGTNNVKQCSRVSGVSSTPIDETFLYLTVYDTVVSAILVREDEGVQKPIIMSASP